MPVWWMILAAFFTIMIVVCGAIGLLLLVELVSDWREEKHDRILNERRNARRDQQRTQALEDLARRDAQRDMRVAALFETFAARQASPITELDREWLHDLGIAS